MAHRTSAPSLHLLWESALFPVRVFLWIQNMEIKKRLTGSFHLGCSITLFLRTGNTANVEQANWAVIQSVIQGFVKFCVWKNFEMLLEHHLMGRKRMLYLTESSRANKDGLSQLGSPPELERQHVTSLKHVCLCEAISRCVNNFRISILMKGRTAVRSGYLRLKGILEGC